MKFKVKAFSLLALYLYRIGQVFQLQQRIVLCYQPIQLHLFNKEHHSWYFSYMYNILISVEMDAGLRWIALVEVDMENTFINLKQFIRL